jgi:iron complex transport system ATP-binding protein
MTGILEVNNLSCGYDSKPVIKDISFSVKFGDFLGIVGPNGCGKTTLLRALCGLLSPQSGEIRIKNRKISELSRGEIARRIAYVPQLMEPVTGFTVEEMILIGRTPYFDRFGFEGSTDHEITKWAIEELKIIKLQHLPVTQLSGGEFQRVVIARALAQQPKVLLLDEPISHLDLRFQVKILRLLSRLRRTCTVIATFHDLSIASKFCPKLMLLKNGEMLSFGAPDEVLNQENIWKAFRVKASVRRHPKTKRARYVVIP